MTLCLGHGLSHFISLPIIIFLSLQLFTFPFRSEHSQQICVAASAFTISFGCYKCATKPGTLPEFLGLMVSSSIMGLDISSQFWFSLLRAHYQSTGLSHGPSAHPEVPWHRDLRTWCCPHHPPHSFSPLQRSLQSLGDLAPLYRKFQALS